MTNTNSGTDRKAIIMDKFVNWSLRWIPDSMVFVLLLTFIVLGLALAFGDHGPW